jgi:hypothetical protein
VGGYGSRAAIGAGARSTGSTLRPARRSAAMKSRPAPRALPSAVPGDCGRCRRPGLGISTTIPSSVCSNPFSRWSSRSTSLAWSNRPSHPEAEVVTENCRELCDCYKFILLGLLSVGFCRRPCARSDVAADPRPRLLRTLNRPPITRGTEGSNPLPSSGESYANLISSIEVPKILPSGGQRWHDGAWPAVAEGKHEESDENCGGCIPWRGFREPRPDGAPIVINK